MVVVGMEMSATTTWSVVNDNWCLMVLGTVRIWFLCRLHWGHAIRRGAIRAVVSRMEIIEREKALVRSGRRKGSWIWGARRLIDVSPDRGGHVHTKRGQLLLAPRSQGTYDFSIHQQ